MLKTITLAVLLLVENSLATEFLPEKTRLKIFDKVISEIERLDGEALPIRKNRPQSWQKTIQILREQAKRAQTSIDFGQVFRKLDATYPNLHAQLVLSDEYDLSAGRLRPRISVRFGAEVIERNKKVQRYLVNAVETAMMKNFKETTRPAIGDEVVAINGRSLKDWSEENFVYCKFPLREQCEANFFDHFRKAMLSWDWRTPLKYTLQRNGRQWEIEVPIEMPNPNPAPNASLVSSGDSTQTKEAECPVESGRYESFKPVFKGLNICAFESEKYPNVVVLRIASFVYRNLPKESKIQSLSDEVEIFYTTYWKSKAPITKKLIIDVIDNGGGDTPVAWYQIFTDKPFQEEYVQFKKTSELENDVIRKDLFYDDGGKEIWFAEFRKSPAYKKLKMGEFLPQVPQFCVAEDKDCNKGLFDNRQNGFKGDVHIMVNEWCISSCTGFVWNMKDLLKKRVKVFGVPDSGDSAYARLFLDVYLDASQPDGFRTEIAGRTGRTRQKLPEGAMLRQQITATRSTDSHGKIISATPTPVDVWVPYRYRHYDDSWEAKVFQAALK